MGKHNHTALIHNLGILALAGMTYQIGVYLLGKLGVDAISSVLSQGSFFIGVFIFAEWQVRNKQNSITEKAEEKFSKTEQRRLNVIVEARNNRSNYRMIYFLCTGVALYSSPLLSKLDFFKPFIIPLSMSALAIGTGLTIVNYINYKEVESFNREIETRSAERKRREVAIDGLKAKEAPKNAVD